MTWRVARSLDTLLGQWNAAHPRRSKTSDGSIGDAAHASRTSDHNPWVIDAGVGVVTARDYTHDPANGADCQALANALVRSNDPRIKYVIWNRRIWTPGVGWKPYTGTNPHDKHLHLSVDAVKSLYDDTRPWAVLDAAPQPAAKPIPLPVPEDDMPYTDKQIAQFASDGVSNRVITEDGGKPIHTWEILRDLYHGQKAENAAVTALTKLVAEQNGLRLEDVRRVVSEEITKGVDVDVTVQPGA